MITGHWGNQEANKLFSRIKWKWQDKRAQSMSYNESNPKRKVYNTKKLKILICLSFHFALSELRLRWNIEKVEKVIQKLSVSLADWWVKLIRKHLLWMSVAHTIQSENNCYYVILRTKINIPWLDYFTLWNLKPCFMKIRVRFVKFLDDYHSLYCYLFTCSFVSWFFNCTHN